MLFESIFYPESVAIVGASPKRSFFILPLLEPEFKGKVFLINPNYDDILGLKCYKSILDIKEPVEYVIVSVPANKTPDAVRDCVKKGVKVVHIFTAGFSETGSEDGKKLEEELIKIAEGNLRIIGPNCMGVYCPESGMAFIDDMPKGIGPVGFVAQSGAHAENVPLSGMLRGVKFSKVVSYGNAIDLDCPDFIGYLSDDQKTKVIIGYIEGVKDGKKFMEVLKETAKKKPVVILKGGRTKEGAQSASSHTGSLAGSGVIWDAVFKQTGVVFVKSLDELLDTTLAFVNCPLPRGKNISMVTFSGGSSVVQTDACIEMGLSVPQFNEKTVERLKEVTYSVGTGIRNPLDNYYAYFGSSGLLSVIKLIVSDERIDAVMLEISATYTRSREGEIYDNFIKNVIDSNNYVQNELKKPFMIALPETRYREEMDKLQKIFLEAEIAVYPTIERAARSILNMYGYYEFLSH